MTKSQKIQPLDARPSNAWARTHGGYIAGRAYADEADYTACQMETKWGADRLRLLVTPELREKFDRQRYLFNQALWHGDLEAVRYQSGRMVKAWLALDAAATELRRQPLAPTVWEVALDDGTVAAIVRSDGDAAAVQPEGRQVAVYSLEEIARFLSAYPDVAKAKVTFPGAEVTQVARSVSDPLDAIADSKDDLDDPIPF